MSNILGGIKRVLFTKNRKQTPALSEAPSLIPNVPFDIYEPPTPLLEKLAEDDDFDAPLPPRGFFAKIWVSGPFLWLRRVEIKVKTGTTIRQRIKRYNAIHQGGYGAPDTSVKAKR